MLFAQCPACHARYKVPDEVAGRRARCKKCGQPFQIPVAQPDSGRLSLTDLTPPDEGSTVIQTRVQLDKPTRGKVGKGVRLRGEAEEEQVAAPGVWGPFLRGLASSLWSPFRPINIAPFLIVWILLTISTPALLSFLICPLLGFAVWAIINGWYFSFQFNTVVNAADGKEELPTLTLTSGVMEDVVMPLVKMGLARLLAVLPAIIFLASVSLARSGSLGLLVGSRSAPSALNIYRTAAGTGADAAIPIVTLALLAAGFALWPMLVLVAAIGGARAMFRFDLMLQTFVRTIPAYACVLFTVYAAEAISIVLGVAIAWGHDKAAPGPLSISSLLVVPALISAADLYMTIIATRVIGLYYHHFKQKFAWSWG
jgi:predicted Zn finger-like uncharacterized protein